CRQSTARNTSVEIGGLTPLETEEPDNSSYRFGLDALETPYFLIQHGTLQLLDADSCLIRPNPSLVLQIYSVSESRSPFDHQSHLLPCNRPLDGTVITRPDRRSLSLGECPIDFDSGFRRRLRNLRVKTRGRTPQRTQPKINRVYTHGTTPHESDFTRSRPRDTPRFSFAGPLRAFV
ncbi:MAG: hypothetical protein ACP5O0_06435, partial [Acidimicrobiales bacterium]